MYHETSMIIPLANAIYDGNIDIQSLYKNKNSKFKDKIIQNLRFSKVSKEIFL